MLLTLTMTVVCWLVLHQAEAEGWLQAEAAAQQAAAEGPAADSTAAANGHVPPEEHDNHAETDGNGATHPKANGVPSTAGA